MLNRKTVSGPLPSESSLFLKILPNSDGTSTALSFVRGSATYDLFATTFTSKFETVKSVKILASAQISDQYLDAASDGSGNLLIAFHSGSYSNEDIYALSVSEISSLQNRSGR